MTIVAFHSRREALDPATVPATKIIAYEDHYVFGCAELVLASAHRDAARILVDLQAPTIRWTLTVESDFSIQCGDTGSAEMTDLLRKKVRDLRARRSDGTLRLLIGDNCVLTVPPNDNYEAWQLLSSNDDRLVAVAGGGVAVWRARR